MFLYERHLVNFSALLRKIETCSSLVTLNLMYTLMYYKHNIWLCHIDTLSGGLPYRYNLVAYTYKMLGYFNKALGQKIDKSNR